MQGPQNTVLQYYQLGQLSSAGVLKEYLKMPSNHLFLRMELAADCKADLTPIPFFIPCYLLKQLIYTFSI